MGARIRAFMLAAMLRQAEGDLARHRAQGHRVRAFFLERKVERLRRRVRWTHETGQRIADYLEQRVSPAPRLTHPATPLR